MLFQKPLQLISPVLTLFRKQTIQRAMKPLLIALVIFVLLSCEKENVSSDCVEKMNPNVVCTMQYDPVCGCNNKTYGNACLAGAAGIRIIAQGECTSAGK